MSNEFLKNSFLFGQNTSFIEELFEKYKKDTNSVDENWKNFFSEIPSDSPYPSWQKRSNKLIFEEESLEKEISKANDSNDKFDNNNHANNKPKFHLSDDISNITHLYRKFGHIMANLDPLSIDIPKTNEEVGIEYNEKLHKIYASSIGVEFEHVFDLKEQEWLYDNFEKIQSLTFAEEDKKYFIKELVKIEGLEQFLHRKFPGAKRFSAEGGDSSVIATKIMVDESSKNGVKEMVLGMAHRGRLNTLTNVMGKPYKALLAEFLGKPTFGVNLKAAGDVKYHMGYSNDLISKYGNKIHLSLTPNPSHLEAVNPVVAGRVRAKQDMANDTDRSKIAGILIHGDSAFCGQGVVAESLMMSPLKAYNIGGILHIVINNQVGFTATSDDTHPLSRYSTDFARIISAPILHVNGDDVEAVARAAIFACEYRAKYRKDIILEIICYRKYGHNEGDEPMYTQPLMYEIVKNKKTPAEIYAQKESLEEFYIQEKENFKNLLEIDLEEAEDYVPEVDYLSGVWKGYSRAINKISESNNSGYPKGKLLELARKLCNFPDDLNVNPKLKKLFSSRLEDLEKNSELDWATAEQLAFASLLAEGYPVRITGQDAERGTFSHRHSVLHDQKNARRYIPLNNISDNQKLFEVTDSNLSEYAVLGFEFGYSMTYPNSLVIWEAQFGDFANGAQIIFDQFVSSSETKWLRLSGLTVLLPHGFEGQGPEHSSARLERFLQLCADDNMKIVYPTTPATIFHLLRKQMISNLRRPLIIMSPKSIFRNKLAVSKLDDIDINSKLNKIIGEIDDIDHKKVKKVVLCSGKIYYDLLEKRREIDSNEVALIRVEQLYPFPFEDLNDELSKYDDFDLFWVQEEPRNMGAWEYIYSRCAKIIKGGDSIEYIGRDESASPAVGYLSVHNKEQASIIDKVFK